MPTYLLLTDPEVCPACHYRSKPRHFRECRVCHELLFLRPIQFRKYEDDGGIREWWYFTGQTEGWKHRDNIIHPEKSVAQIRDVKAEKVAPNNSTTPEEVAMKFRGKRRVPKSEQQRKSQPPNR